MQGVGGGEQKVVEGRYPRFSVESNSVPSIFFVRCEGINIGGILSPCGIVQQEKRTLFKIHVFFFEPLWNRAGCRLQEKKVLITSTRLLDKCEESCTLTHSTSSSLEMPCDETMLCLIYLCGLSQAHTISNGLSLERARFFFSRV